jgi:hypothetical protein
MKRSEPKRMLRLPQVQQIIRSVKIGANAVAWIEEEIIAWQDTHIAQRDALEARKREVA